MVDEWVVDGCRVEMSDDEKNAVKEVDEMGGDASRRRWREKWKKRCKERMFRKGSCFGCARSKEIACIDPIDSELGER